MEKIDIIFWILGIGFIFIFGLMMFMWYSLTSRLDRFENRMDKFDEKLDSINNKIGEVDKKLYVVEKVLHMKDYSKQDE